MVTDLAERPAPGRRFLQLWTLPDEAVAILLLAAVAVGIRAFWLSHPALSETEIDMILASRAPAGGLLSLEFGPGAMSPPYALALKGIIALFGEDRAAMRGLSVLFGAASVPVVYLLVREWLQARVAYVAGIFTCVLPIHVEVSRTVGPDAAMMFFLLIATWALVALLREDASASRWRQFALAGLIAIGLIAATLMRASAVAMIPLFVIAAYLSCGWDIRKLGAILLAIFAAWVVCLSQATGFYGIAADRLSVTEIEAQTLRDLVGRVAGSGAVPALGDPVVATVYLIGALLLLWYVPRFAAVVLILHLFGAMSVALAGPLLSGAPMPAIMGFAPLAVILLSAAVAVLPKVLAAGAVMLLVAFQMLQLVGAYPLTRVANEGDALRAALDALPRGTSIFYDAGMLREFAAFPQVPPEWTPLQVDELGEGAMLVSAQLGNCTGTDCGPVAIVMERAPAYFAADAEKWMSEMDALSTFEAVLQDEDISGYRLMLLDPAGRGR